MSRYSADLAVSTGLVTALPVRRPRWLNTGSGVNDTLEFFRDESESALIRHVHGERDFGVGYGNSSGYGTDRHYVTDWAPQMFRCR